MISCNGISHRIGLEGCLSGLVFPILALTPNEAFTNCLLLFIYLQPARHTKLEKADILEMTVKHLQNIQRQQMILTAQTDSTILHKFKSGFVDCADEVTRFIGQMDGLDMGVRQRVSNHLNNCVSNIQQQININTSPFGQFGQHQSSSSPFPLLSDMNNNNNAAAAMNGRGGIQVNGVQLVPSRLPSGEIALIMPNNMSLNSLLNNTSSPTPTFNPIVKSTPTTNGLIVPSGNYPTYPRMSAFNPIISAQSHQYSSNMSSSPSLHANNSPPLSPVSSISSSDLDSHPYNMMNSSTVATTTPPLSSSGAANSSSSLNISSPSDVSMLAVHPRLQQPQVSSTTQQLPKKRSYAMMNEAFDQSSSTDSEEHHTEEKSPKLDVDDCAKDDMWRPW